MGRKNRALTITEVLVTLGIVAVVVALLVATIPHLIKRAQRVSCINNLRALHTSFNAYIVDHGNWPQEPLADQQDWIEKWWLWVMKPYGVTEKTWECPTIKQGLVGHPNPPLIHYIPTHFDKEPQTPYKWPRQPWFIEIANAHGSGALVCFTDGSIRSMDEVLRDKK